MSLFLASDPPFDSCWLKFARVREHVDSLKNEIVTWEKLKKHRLANVVNAEMTRYSVIMQTTGSPPLRKWALIAADCFHNLRTVLDQLIYAVAVHQTGQDPPPKPKALQFPICDTAENFRKERWRIEALSDPVQAVIERAQPYNRPHYAVPPLLALLRDFDDMDKHRFLQNTLLQCEHGGFEGIKGLAPGQPAQMQFCTDEVKDNTEIAALILDRPTPNVRYEVFRVTMHVAVRHAPSPRQDRTAVQGLLGVQILEVERILQEIYVAL